MGGVVCFALLLVFSIQAFQDIRRFLVRVKGDISYSFLIIAIFSGLFLVLMVEPIMDGIVNLFILFCLYKGLLTDTFPQNHEQPDTPDQATPLKEKATPGIR